MTVRGEYGGTVRQVETAWGGVAESLTNGSRLPSAELNRRLNRYRSETNGNASSTEVKQASADNKSRTARCS